MADDSWVVDRDRAPHGIDPGAPAAALEPWIVGLLACPMDRGEVRLDPSGLVCVRCDRHYLVLSGIPRMIPHEAEGEQKF